MLLCKDCEYLRFHKGLKFNYCDIIHNRSEGHVWVSTYGDEDGLLAFDPDKFGCTEFEHKEPPPCSLECERAETCCKIVNHLSVGGS